MKKTHEGFEVNINFIFIVPTIWIFAYIGIQNLESSITMSLLKIGFYICMIDTLFTWFLGLQTRKNRAIFYTLAWSIPALVTGIIYFSKISEYVCGLVEINNETTVIITIIWLLAILIIGVVLFRLESRRFINLYRLGYLDKYNILKIDEGVYNPTFTLPGIDGSSLEEAQKKETRLAKIITLLPISAVTFVLIRTGSNLIIYLLLFFYFLPAIFFFFFGIRIIAMMLAILHLEKENDIKIFVNNDDK